MKISILLKRTCLALCCLTLLLSCKSEPKITYDVIIKNGNLIDLEDGSVSISNILITNNRIVKIIADADLTSIEAETIIDATGKFIVPGFWDNHTHFRGGDSLINANKNFLKLFMANGITTVRDAGGDLTSSVLEWRKAIANNELVGPTIFTSGPKIDGPGGTWAGSLEVDSDEDITKALDSLQAIPSDFVKIYDSRISGENYIKVIQEAEKRGLITSGHMPFTVELDATIDAGIDAVEHLYYIMKGSSAQEKEITQQLINKEIGFWDAMPLLQSSYSDSTALKTFEHLKSKNVFVVPTLHIGGVLSYLDEVNHSNDAYLKYMSDGIQHTYKGRIDRVKFASEKQVADRKALDRFFGELALKLNENGVSLLAGSDSGAYNSYTYPGISLHKEMEAMVATGISPLDALKSSAYNGAKFLKQDSDYGTICEGKIADIVLLNSNPLENIKNTQDIFMVLSNGNQHTRTELDNLLNSAIAN
ncbi:imidazolonepropionase-like amidohydrolase [Maribacter spongiicola]|uniref:Imidazolonepropionase-like amidohydrolase n=1 Tax=Maribacter spongiicola TaxID=1206753 RepID=A0A4R7K5U0_9FLAO|nr:amidohydrolase family protein [Maribacter spongiicola]TDT45607.1 imidazolonepropionase-like amidohydrolase [Maribacter spongiicola]